MEETDYGHWEYPCEFDPDDWFGFIYRIVYLPTGKQYIGKKQFHQHLRKKVANRKNRKRVVKKSNWKEYTGSSKALNEDIKNLGKENFIFLIESLHKTKGSLFYAEVEKQIKENVLREQLDDGTRKYYNGIISGVKFIPPDEQPEETQHKLMESLQERGYHIPK